MRRLFVGGHYYAQLWDFAAPIRGRPLNGVRRLFDEIRYNIQCIYIIMYIIIIIYIMYFCAKFSAMIVSKTFTSIMQKRQLNKLYSYVL